MGKKRKPRNRQKTGFRGPSPDVGKATQFKPGQPSPNPNGRPRTAKFSEACQRLAAEIDPKTELTGAQTLALHAYRKALRGSARHAEIFLNYAEGKPRQAFEIAGSDGGPLKIEDLPTNPADCMKELQKLLAEQGLKLVPTEEGDKTEEQLEKEIIEELPALAEKYGFILTPK
jgi:hypothetical protein